MHPIHLSYIAIKSSSKTEASAFCGIISAYFRSVFEDGIRMLIRSSKTGLKEPEKCQKLDFSTAS